jgi:predicted O-methyltransferase YrrM
MTTSTVEQTISAILASLRSRNFGFLDESVDWAAYQTASNRIHAHFNIPATAITPPMRRTFFAIGNLWPDPNILGLGTYVGYAVSWMWAGAVARHGSATLTGYDIDASAVERAAANFYAAFGPATNASFVSRDALQPGPGDDRGILYIDIDDPDDGKWGYLQALDAHVGSMNRPGLVLAHDPVVPKFADAMAAFQRRLVDSGFEEPVVLPLDNCGILLAQLPKPSDRD